MARLLFDYRCSGCRADVELFMDTPAPATTECPACAGEARRRYTSRGLALTGKSLRAMAPAAGGIDCRDNPDVHPAHEGLSEPPNLALLKRTQQLGLNARAELRDLVQEERSTGGLLEQPLPIGRGAGERALHVSEELGFDELVHERSTVDGAELPIAAGAAGVNRAGRKLLSRPAFAFHDHGKW